MEQLVILQSGYLSYPNEDLITNSPAKDTTVLQLVNLNRADTRTNSPYHYSREVDSIYDALQDDHKILKDFDYRERVLTAAKHAFKSEYFVNWLTMQRRSQFLTTMHRKFLLDTLDYIANGKRYVNVESWRNIVELRDMSDVDKRCQYNPELYFVNDGSMAHTRKLVEVLAKWVSHPTGFNDLIMTLFIIFGKNNEWAPV